MTEGFYFENADAAIKFFEACEAVNAITYEDRMIVMRRMVREKKAKYLRDPEAFLDGKKILKLDQKDSTNE